jgi:hypothetical protein
VEGAQSEVAPPAIDGEAHGPALAPAGIDLEVEAAAIGVPARRSNVLDGIGRETVDTLGVARTHAVRSSSGTRGDFPHVFPHSEACVHKVSQVASCSRASIL